MKKFAATSIQFAAALGVILMVNSSSKGLTASRKGSEKGQALQSLTQEATIQYKDSVTAIRGYLLDPMVKSEWERQNKSGLAALQGFKAAKTTSGNSVLNSLIDEWVGTFEKSEPLRAELADMVGQNHFKDAQKYFFATYIPATQKLEELAEKIRIQAGMEAKLQADLHASATQAGGRRLVFSITALLMAAVAASFFLSSSSKPIASGSSVLSEIASRMKMVSFNASIETARAGIEGRGFAIVTEEILRISQELQTMAGTPTQMLPPAHGELRAQLEALSLEVQSLRQAQAQVPTPAAPTPPQMPPQLKVVSPGPTPPVFKGPKKPQDNEELNWKVG